MKKLSLLKPDKRQVFLEKGKGQSVNYLNIPKDIDVKTLEKDVQNGATHFKELLTVANKKPSRVVVIDCTNEEQGLMAVTYLAAIYNKKDKVVEYEYNPDEEFSTVGKFKDIKDYEDYFIDAVLDNDPDVYCEDDLVEWEECAFSMPIITAKDILNDYNDPFNSSPFQENNFFVNGIGVNNNKIPYWYGLRREPICIIDDKRKGMVFSGGQNLSEKIERFSNNRHVFILNVHETYKNTQINMNEYDEEGGFNPYSENKQNLYTLILEHTAELIEVKSSPEELMEYHKCLFDNWAPALGVSLSKGFPKDKIFKQIIKMRTEEKSALIEKVYRYVINQDGVGHVLYPEDFSIISKFKVLGAASDSEDDENKSLKKLESELIGLEEVKKQIYGMVEVMKYHKKRNAMGYGSSGYHNVHLMIGAPGTAKTTMAQLLGNIMMEQKLIPGNRFVSINGADLKGMYVGHSAPKTKAYFDSYDIIFIDEAYSLTSGNEMDSFSQEALAQLVIELEKHGLDKLVIFAGYGGIDVEKKDNKMLQFIEANPGIRSRINSTIYFKSYTPNEMVDIIHCLAKNGKFNLTHEGDDLIRDYFQKRYKKADFGNGREARSFIENVSYEAARRVMQLDEKKQTKKAMCELTLEDVKKAINRMEKAGKMQNGKGGNNVEFGFTTK